MLRLIRLLPLLLILLGLFLVPVYSQNAEAPASSTGGDGKSGSSSADLTGGFAGLFVDMTAERHNVNPASIRTQEPGWRWFLYVGFAVGGLNILAAIFIMTHTVPHVIKRKKKKAGEVGPENSSDHHGNDTESAVIKALKRVTMFLPIRQGEVDYLEQEDETLPENHPLPVVGRKTSINTHLALEEARRNEHRFAFYTSGTDFLMTAMIQLNLIYSFVRDHTLMPPLLCSGFGYGIYALINMDCILVAYEAVLSYLAVCAPTENRKKGRYHWRVWLILVLVPWLFSAALWRGGSFGPDIFWCFVMPEGRPGKSALAFMCAVHYTVLIIVVMTYLPMVAIKPKAPPGHKPSEVAKARAREAKMTAYHLLVHILHYTPGTFHAFAGFSGYEPFWVYVMTIIALQMGAIVHAMVIVWSWFVERKHKKRAKAAAEAEAAARAASLAGGLPSLTVRPPNA